LRRKMEGGLGGLPSNLKQRIINSIDDDIVDAYHEPSAIYRSYVTKMVNASRTREFLDIPKNLGEADVTVDIPAHLGETRDHLNLTDLGMEYDIGKSVGAYITNHGYDRGLSRADVAKIHDVLVARFSARGHSQLLSDAKNITYISVLGNFGAAITQLGDQSFSMHFNGLGPTFKAWFDKSQPDWYKHFGLDSTDIDLQSSRDGLSKVLNKVLTWTGFKALDKFGKNTVMKSTFIRMRNLAKNKPDKLIAELEPKVGRDTANQIRRDLLSDDPFTDVVEGVIWSRLLDLQPAAKSEMTVIQSSIGGLQPGVRELAGSAYWLKTFTIKQWDVFREASNGKIGKAHELWNKGDKNEAVKMAAQGLVGVTGLAITFGAVNMGTSAIKDVLYGRPTNMDDLLEDTLFRLVGGSRYHMWRARREGIGKAAMEFFMPATTALDRAGKDLWSLSEGEAPVELYRGIGVGDFYYWHYGGGREKLRKDLAKKYGVPLEYVPK